MNGFDEYLAEFSEPRGYLNFASYGPPSQRVLGAVAEAMRAAASGADGLHEHDSTALAAVSRLTGFTREGCALTTSTSAGLQQIAFGLAGGRVLVGRAEFPSNLYPWWRAQEAGLLTVREAGPGAGPWQTHPDTIAAALEASTTAVAVSAVDFRTGYRTDLAALREVIGDRLLIVDGIQGFGVLDQDWTPADALVVGGQKWLRAGWGTGFVCLSPRALERLRPTLGGWTGVLEPSRYDGLPHPPHDDARRLSVTNPSPFTSAALTAALDLLETAGPANVAERTAHTATVLIDALDAAGVEVLSPRAPAERAGIVVARVADAQQTAGRLALKGVTVTAHPPDRVRFAVHATTRPSAPVRAVGLLTDVS
ncbi:aminotransferase class V-fold PLP-dependent enzyme [Kineosporia sp. J2-2]|uniref:Aminotransferase class V-fold PLP-dependent enzyme n=1 Tax=Kineosporia corallincola TaxID=2835133 RepID=A0ABS5TKA1_9ACTN|nr:aminotransferase class V-fold PLP-dependent enzyme [Kineosporia corallincola]MBT0771525.1 aminotransferase class V-fold PLP-dependent enzyme [Kineosporia corallincola]